jgi:hypothetical protein
MVSSLFGNRDLTQMADHAYRRACLRQPNIGVMSGNAARFQSQWFSLAN